MARFCMRTFVMVALPMFVMACAQGFQGNDDDDDDQPRIDAPVGSIDAPIGAVDARIDAPVSNIDAPGLPIDAPVSLPDAGGGTGQVGDACTASAQCDQAQGLCCSILAVCFVDPQQPGFCI